MSSLAKSVAMVRATHFGANPETLRSNAFQSAHTDVDATLRASREQEALAMALERAGIQVVWLEPPAGSISPDGVFPNNWFSTHEDGRLVLYPMEAPSRRSERMPDLASRLRREGFHIDDVLDFSPRAASGQFLEGTGSLILDRANHIAYFCPSTRTNSELAAEWAEAFDFQLHSFTSTGPDKRPVYHTNVVMSLGANLAIVCLESIPDWYERKALRARLEETGHEVVEISWTQVRRFAGNQLMLQGRDGPVIALSAAANNCLDANQYAVIDRHVQRIPVDIATIERHGGGSVRCMLAEIFLPSL